MSSDKNAVSITKREKNEKKYFLIKTLFFVKSKKEESQEKEDLMDGWKTWIIQQIKATQYNPRVAVAATAQTEFIQCGTQNEHTCAVIVIGGAAAFHYWAS